MCFKFCTLYKVHIYFFLVDLRAKLHYLKYTSILLSFCVCWSTCKTIVKLYPGTRTTKSRAFPINYCALEKPDVYIWLFISWLHPHRVRSTGVKHPFGHKYLLFHLAKMSFSSLFVCLVFRSFLYHFNHFSLCLDRDNYPALSHGN